MFPRFSIGVLEIFSETCESRDGFRGGPISNSIYRYAAVFFPETFFVIFHRQHRSHCVALVRCNRWKTRMCDSYRFLRCSDGRFGSVDKQTWRFLRHDATSVQREYMGRGSDPAVVVPEQNETVARSTSEYDCVYSISMYRVYGGKGAEFLQFFFNP